MHMLLAAEAARTKAAELYLAEAEARHTKLPAQYQGIAVYSQLTAQIQQMKRQRKPLLIKINTHPCAGKSTFISKHQRHFMDCKLLDFDSYSGDRRTSSLLVSMQHNTALFGTADNELRRYHNVVYFYMTPISVSQLQAQLALRHTITIDTTIL